MCTRTKVLHHCTACRRWVLFTYENLKCREATVRAKEFGDCYRGIVQASRKEDHKGKCEKCEKEQAGK